MGSEARGGVHHSLYEVLGSPGNNKTSRNPVGGQPKPSDIRLSVRSPVSLRRGPGRANHLRLSWGSPFRRLGARGLGGGTGSVCTSGATVSDRADLVFRQLSALRERRYNRQHHSSVG